MPKYPAAPPQMRPNDILTVAQFQQNNAPPPALEFSDSSFASAPSREHTGTTSASSVPVLEQNVVERDLGHLNL